MKWTNFHSHCLYCDGTLEPEAHIKAALKEGIISYGFSSHCPVPFKNAWSMKVENISNYLSDINRLKDKYRDQIQIYKSMEVDFIPEMISPHSDIIQQANLDYTVGSVHFVGEFDDGEPWEIDGTLLRFKNGLANIYHDDIKQVIKNYFELTRQMVRETTPEIVGHLDKIKMHNSTEMFFDELSDWYQMEMSHTLEEIKGTDAIIEVNTRGIYKKLTAEPYPGVNTLKRINEMEIPICLNSDSHHPREIVGEFAYTARLLISLGFNKMRVLFDNEWQDVPFDENGLIFS